MSPKDPMDEDEFNRRVELVSQVFWALGDASIASLWDEYVKKKELWAPFARLRAVSNVFEGVSKLPILAVSNNSLER